MAVFLGKENFTCVELKEGRSVFELASIVAALDAEHALPVISKKFAGYGFLRDFRWKHANLSLKNEFPGYEYEAWLADTSYI